MVIKNQTVEEFLNDVGSNKPTPGGGSAAAVTAALAAALTEMACNLTIGKKAYLGVEKQMKLVAGRMQEIRRELLDLADADSDAFEKVMEAIKSEDKAKIKAALYWAIEIPQKVVDLATQVQKMAVGVAKVGNRNTYSDAMSAEHLANAAIEAAQENIEINKRSLLLVNSK
jgi:formiminotetrahydrofolate cyclodeaminase